VSAGEPGSWAAALPGATAMSESSSTRRGDTARSCRHPASKSSSVTKKVIFLILMSIQITPQKYNKKLRIKD
jgi:hypothetical protein